MENLKSKQNNSTNIKTIKKIIKSFDSELDCSKVRKLLGNKSTDIQQMKELSIMYKNMNRIKKIKISIARPNQKSKNW